MFYFAILVVHFNVGIIAFLLRQLALALILQGFYADNGFIYKINKPLF